MIKYYITIVIRATGTVHHLERTEDTLSKTIIFELGGWDNLYAASTSGISRHDKEYFQAGTTKDNTKCFSILAVWIE